MTVPQIANGELGLSVRNKINTALVTNRRRMRTIVAWGDSITAGSTVLTGTVNPTTAGVAVGYGPGYAEAIIRASNRWSELNNSGYPGQTAEAILARFAIDVLAYSPDACLIMAGTNNLTSGMSAASMKSALQTVETMVSTCISAGIFPILVTPPPKNGAALEARVFASFLYDLADFYRVPLFDLHRLLVNAQTGSYASGTTYSSDGTHPLASAISLIQAQFSSLLASIETYNTPAYTDPVSNTAVNQTITNLLRNGSFAYAASSPTPDSWSVNATGATQTLNAVGPGVAYPYTGNEFQYVKSSGGGVYPLYGAAATIVAGNRMRISGSVEVSGLTPASASGFHLGAAFGSGYFQPFRSWVQNGKYDFCADFVVPAGQTSATPQFYVADSGTYKVRNLTLIDLTARAAIYTPGQI